MYITYPTSIKSSHYCFKLNTDDFFDPKPIDSFLKSKGIEFKRTKQTSSIKLMSWHVYKIKADDPIKIFQQNIEFIETLFNNYENNN